MTVISEAVQSLRRSLKAAQTKTMRGVEIQTPLPVDYFALAELLRWYDQKVGTKKPAPKRKPAVRKTKVKP